jgi:hypothetical protein
MFEKANTIQATPNINDRLSAQELPIGTLFSFGFVVDSEEGQLHSGLTGYWAAPEEVGEKQAVHQ